MMIYLYRKKTGDPILFTFVVFGHLFIFEQMTPSLITCPVVTTQSM